jgi:CBS domain-containing protein
MRARDLAEEYPSVTLGSDILEAARLLAGGRLPGLLVVDERGGPQAVLPASHLVKLLVPGYVIEDPALARVVDEQHADRLCQALAGRPVSDALPPEHDRHKPPTADAEDTALEVAALMARERSPLVVVTEGGGDEVPARGAPPRMLGVITAPHLLDRLLGVT